MAALKNSKTVSPILNNFSNNFGNYGQRLIEFFVCSYDCKNAIKIARQVANYVKQNTSKSNDILTNLRHPMIFFSPSEIIYPFSAHQIKDRIYYTDCFSRKKYPSNTHNENKKEFNSIFSYFSNGDSFSINDKEIKIYKHDNLIFKIKKKHKYYGVFIQFDKLN